MNQNPKKKGSEEEAPQPPVVEESLKSPVLPVVPNSKKAEPVLNPNIIVDEAKQV